MGQRCVLKANSIICNWNENERHVFNNRRLRVHIRHWVALNQCICLSSYHHLDATVEFNTLGRRRIENREFTLLDANECEFASACIRIIRGLLKRTLNLFQTRAKQFFCQRIQKFFRALDMECSLNVLHHFAGLERGSRR